MLIKIAIAALGGLCNRIRGGLISKFHTEINMITYGLTVSIFYSLSWVGVLVMTVAMWLGQATGWTEMLHAGKGSFELSEREDYSWMSYRWYALDFKNFGVFKPTNQWNAWAFGWLRGMIWAVPIFIGFAICGVLNFWLFLFPVLFYPCYRLSYLVLPKTYFWLAEVLAGIVLWFLSILGIK